MWNQFNVLPSVASFEVNCKTFLISVFCIYISRLALYVYCCVWLIDTISSKIVPLEKVTVIICGANALSLLPVVLFISFINVHLWFFSFLYLLGSVGNVVGRINEVKQRRARLQAGKPSLYVASHPGQLSLAIPPWVGAVSTSESWDVNRHTARCSSRVPCALAV